MVDVDALTDDELRTKLVEYGFPVMPITGTTRSLMAKKLKLLMENKGKSSSDRRSLGKFSSDEDSDADVKAAKKDKNRRITMAVPPMQQTKASSANREEKQEMVPPSALPVLKEKRKSAARSAKIIVQVKESAETNSDSEPEVTVSSGDSKKTYEIEVPLTKPTTTKKNKDEEQEEEEDLPPKVFKSPETSYSLSSRVPASPSRYTTYTSPKYDVNDELAKIRARLSLSSRTVQSSLQSNRDLLAPKDDEEDDDADNSEEPVRFLSNFTRRLSASRNGASLGLGASEDRDYSDTGAGLYSRGTSSNFSARSRTAYSSKPSYDNSPSSSVDKPTKTSNISFIIIAAVILFFIILAALYYGMHSDSAVGISGKTSKYDLKEDSL